MSDFSRQIYSNLSSWRRARYIAYVQQWEAQLTLIDNQITELLGGRPIESYNFNAGDGGSQAATYRKLSELNKIKEDVIAQINKYNLLLYGGGIVNHDSRRK